MKRAVVVVVVVITERGSRKAAQFVSPQFAAFAAVLEDLLVQQ